MRSPSFLILIAAFWSRLMVNPQSHSIVRTDKFLAYHKCFGIYATDFSMRSPSFLILIAAFWSRLMVNPQSHSIVRTDTSFISGCNLPQQWHRCDDGNHLSTLTKYFNPQSHSIVRTDTSFISGCNLPQQWHRCDDGNHLSTLTKYFFLSESLYESIDRNNP